MIKKLARLLNKLPNTVSSFSGVEKTLLRVVGVCVDIVSPGAYFARYRLREDPLESPDEGSKLTRIVGKTNCSAVVRGVGLKDNRTQSS